MASHSALPSVRKTAMGGFLTGIVAVLVFISGLAVAAAGSIGALVDTWNTSVTGTLTVQIPGTAAESAKKAEAVVAAVVKLPEIKRAEVIARDKLDEMLKPWLGDERLIAALPLPALIDVELSAPSPEATMRVTAAIKAAAPEAVIDDHRIWLNRIADFATALSYLALALIALSLAALTLTVILATRAGLTEHAHVIEVLHLVGARDRYIAAQFSGRALRQTLIGGALGLLAFAPALAAIAWLARRIDPGILPPVTLPLPYWIALALLPVIAAVIAFVAAAVTVRRALTAMV